MTTLIRQVSIDPIDPDHDGCKSVHREYIKKFATFPTPLGDRWIWFKEYYAKFTIVKYEWQDFPFREEARYHDSNMTEDEVLIEMLIEGF